MFFWRFFANIFLLVCRAATNFLRTQRARLSGPFRYLEHVRKVNKKFSRGLWKKFQPKKKWGFVRISQLDFELHFFKISTFFTFPDIKSDRCVVRSRFFFLTQRARLSGPFRYLEHVRKVNKKFSRGLWKKLRFWKKWSSKSSWNILTKTNFFGLKLFFKGL